MVISGKHPLAAGRLWPWNAQLPNLLVGSADIGDVGNSWHLGTAGTSTVPTITLAAATAPDGTHTASQIALSAVSDTNSASNVYQSFTASTQPFTLAVWLRMVSGTGTVYVYIGNSIYAVTACSLTTTWQRFSVTTPAMTAATYYASIGVDARFAGQTTQPAQTIYAWGAMVAATSYPPVYRAT